MWKAEEGEMVAVAEFDLVAVIFVVAVEVGAMMAIS